MRIITNIFSFISKLFQKKYIIIAIVIIILIPVSYTFSKYIVNIAHNYYLESKHFYFNSNRLDTNNPIYRVNNWSGISDFTIDVELNSRKNELETAPMDIDYQFSYTCDNTVICSATKNGGTIYSASNTDSISITIHPNQVFNAGDVINVDVTANATNPYEKTISAKFLIAVGQQGVSYEIIDKANQAYFNLDITNAATYYTVNTAFGNYNVNDQMNYDEYNSLTSSEKEKCTSKLITLSFDPREVLVDTTNKIIKNAENTGTTNINGFSYINSVSFKIDALSSNAIRFYKKDKTQNYTYPFNNNNSIVTFVASG